MSIPGLSAVKGVAAGNYHVLAVKSDGSVVGWGLNNAGQLGDGTATTRTSSVTVKGLAGRARLARARAGGAGRRAAGGRRTRAGADGPAHRPSP